MHTNVARSMTRVMLVDDHRSVRQGLRFLLESQPDVAVVGEAGSVAGAVEGVCALLPDVVIMDARLPDGSGVEACRTIRSHHPDLPMLMLTSAPDHEALILSLMAGADGFVPKQLRGNLVVKAIRRLMSGLSLHDPFEVARVLEKMRADAGSRPMGTSLTSTERRIVQMIAKGATNREIATRIGLDETTINAHVSAMLSTRLGGRRAELADILAEHWAHVRTA
jgi:two-component system, NarL family, response regulator DevR